MKKMALCLVASALCLWGAESSALDPDVKCHFKKLKEAAKLVSCRLKAEAKAVKKELAPDFSKCEKFDLKWTKIDLKGGMDCPTSGDQDAVKAYLTNAADQVTTGLDGGCFDNSGCAPDEYCEKGTDNCGGAGTCVAKPLACPLFVFLVCGCDGMQYENPCWAQQAGVSLLLESPCS